MNYTLPTLRKIILHAVFISIIFQNSCKNKQVNNMTAVPDIAKYNKLVWADEFNGSQIDTTRWQFSDAHYWNHEEVQEFRKTNKNGFIRDGKLIIRVLEEKNPNKKIPHYTSACLTTKDKMGLKYGRIDVKARMPFGKGLIAAVSMKPWNDSLSGKEMANAIEMAIVDGSRAGTVMSNVRFCDIDQISRNIGDWHRLEDEEDYTRVFHTYSMIHEPGNLWFFVDGRLFYHASDDLLAPAEYPFDARLFLNLHVAVGGLWAGDPDSLLTAFPQEMEVEYVRIYQSPHNNSLVSRSKKKYFPDINEYNKLVWSDEFSHPQITGEYWTHETGDNWWNKEIQGYTNDSTNAYIENGHLVISANKTASHINSIREYTSARIVTRDKVSFGYGRVDFRLKVDHGNGIWPAAWFLPVKDKYGPWPISGEIDVLEIFGADSLTLSMAAHFGSSRNDHHSRGAKMFKGNGFDDAFHTYSLVREKDHIWWYFDGKPCFHLSKELCLPHHYPFNEDFYAILNIAVGGGTAGYPDKTTAFPKKMYVDYVRYYTK